MLTGWRGYHMAIVVLVGDIKLQELRTTDNDIGSTNASLRFLLSLPTIPVCHVLLSLRPSPAVPLCSTTRKLAIFFALLLFSERNRI